MSSGRTHDAITLILAAPAFGLAYAATGDAVVSGVVTGAFVFGGLMFGPDLDTVSKQYSRWSVFRLLWYPYRSVFKHRSRWSHGLIFGTLFRVVYFMGAVTIAAFLIVAAIEAVWGGHIRGISAFTEAWRQIGGSIRGTIGANILPALFAGMWAGAASHTFTDMTSTYVKTGRVTDFL